MFRVHWDQSDLGAIPKAAVATFFDIYEDVSTFSSLILCVPPLSCVCVCVCACVRVCERQKETR